MQEAAPPPGPAAQPAQPPPTGPAAGYPVVVEVDRQAEYSRFLPLVKWLLAVPHYLVLLFVLIGALIGMWISFFAVLITGRYPRGIFDFVVGALRWAWRVNSYVYLLHDRYPPFSTAHDPAFPARLEIAYPEDGVARWRPFFAWLLALPYLLVAGLLVYVAYAVAFIGVFVILFTKNLPEGMFKLILNPMRWQLRGGAYAYGLVTRYPPFEWE